MEIKVDKTTSIWPHVDRIWSLAICNANGQSLRSDSDQICKKKDLGCSLNKVYVNFVTKHRYNTVHIGFEVIPGDSGVWFSLYSWTLTWIQFINSTESRKKQNEIIVQIREQGFKISETVTYMMEGKSHSAHKCHICFSSSGHTWHRATSNQPMHQTCKMLVQNGILFKNKYSSHTYFWWEPWNVWKYFIQICKWIFKSYNSVFLESLLIFFKWRRGKKSNFMN